MDCGFCQTFLKPSSQVSGVFLLKERSESIAMMSVCLFVCLHT